MQDAITQDIQHTVITGILTTSMVMVPIAVITQILDHLGVEVITVTGVTVTTAMEIAGVFTTN